MNVPALSEGQVRDLSSPVPVVPGCETVRLNCVPVRPEGVQPYADPRLLDDVERLLPPCVSVPFRIVSGGILLLPAAWVPLLLCASFQT